MNINKFPSPYVWTGSQRKDGRIWKTEFITGLLFINPAVVMTNVLPVRMKETDLLTA